MFTLMFTLTFTVTLTPTTAAGVQKRREEACVEQGINIEHTSYADIMQRLVRRYLFKMEREKLKDGALRIALMYE